MVNISVKSVAKLSLVVVGLGLLTVGGVQQVENMQPMRISYYGDIEGDQQYFKLIEMLRSAHYGQRVDIYMLSPGGSVLHGNEIAAAMKASHGYVVYHVGSLAASMAAVLACQADKLDLAPQAVVMYHTIQTDQGAVINPTNPADASFLKAAKILTKNCKFLTQEEYDSIWVGQEVWLTGEEINKRLSK